MAQIRLDQIRYHPEITAVHMAKIRSDQMSVSGRKEGQVEPFSIMYILRHKITYYKRLHVGVRKSPSPGT